ncbi:hypothetical protein JCM3765_002586 [Sporobolomyces pararoseus]
MPFQPLDCRSCALSIHSALSSTPPTLGSLTAEEGNEPEALGLLSQLLQHSFLNGTSSEDSVWTALDQLVSPSLSPRISTTTPFVNLTTVKSSAFFGEIDPLDDGSICVSFPLNFQADSPEKSLVDEIEVVPHTVELIEVTLSSEGGKARKGENGNGEVKGKEEKWWDLKWLHNYEEEKVVSDSTSKKVIVAKKIFDSPKDRLSLRVTWWGYEIYLPEPVFSNVGNDIEPVLTALSYLSTGLALLITKAPAVLVALPGFPLLQTLVPIFSAIISAVTWYWKTIKKMDLGEGVILSATWILPIGVVPRPLRRKELDDTGSIVELKEIKAKVVKIEGLKDPSTEREMRKPNKLRRVLSRSKK